MIQDLPLPGLLAHLDKEFSDLLAGHAAPQAVLIVTEERVELVDEAGWLFHKGSH